MIRYVRSWELKVGRGYGLVFGYLKAVTEYFNTRFPETQFQLFSSRTEPHTVYLMADFEDLAAWDSWWHEHQADEEYGRVMSKAFEGVERPVGISLIRHYTDLI